LRAMSLIISILYFSLFYTDVSMAKDKNFVREYRYQASEIDSKVSCRTNALQQVKRLLLEELGTYLESLTEVKNLQVTKDQIIIYTAGITQTKIVDEKWDGVEYWLKAELKSDPEEITEFIRKFEKERDKQVELRAIQKTLENKILENNMLKQKLEEIKPDGQKDNQKHVQYNNNIKKINAIELYMKAWGVYEREKYDESIGYAKEALTLYPNYANPYALINAAYTMLGQFDLSTEYARKTLSVDFDRKDPHMYVLRGFAYQRLKNYTLAINEYSKAIELNPKSSQALSLKGFCLSRKRKFKHALENTNAALAIDPDNYKVYISRGHIYSKMKKWKKAIKDYERAIELNNESGLAFFHLSIAHMRNGNKNKFIQYCNKSCNLNFKKACKLCVY
jgi:tetratricopeptide (TPR) repeat protein